MNQKTKAGIISMLNKAGRLSLLTQHGVFCAFCGGSWGTNARLPRGAAWSTTTTPKFPEKITEIIEGYEVESVSIQLNDSAFLNLKSVKCTPDTTYVGLGTETYDPTPEFVETKELYQAYAYGLSAPVLPGVDRAVSTVYGEPSYILRKDYNCEEYYSLLKECFKGKTVVFIFKENDSCYTDSNRIVREIIEFSEGEQVYSRKINNRNSGNVLNNLSLEVYKFHD